MSLTTRKDRERESCEIRPTVSFALAVKIRISTSPGNYDPGKFKAWMRIIILVDDDR
jgi:hypothetical protein